MTVNYADNKFYWWFWPQEQAKRTYTNFKYQH